MTDALRRLYALQLAAMDLEPRAVALARELPGEELARVLKYAGTLIFAPGFRELVCITDESVGDRRDPNDWIGPVDRRIFTWNEHVCRLGYALVKRGHGLRLVERTEAAIQVGSRT